VDRLRGDRAERLLRCTQEIEETAVSESRAWRSLEQHAGRISEIAREESTEGIEGSYGAIISICISCHAQQVSSERPLLNPLRWKDLDS
jgi:hypothetical protein